MKGNIYLIYGASLTDREYFLEAISSNYPQKRLDSEVTLILSDETAKEIYDRLTNNGTIGGGVLVTELSAWWGRLPTDVLDWLKSKGVPIVSE